MGKGFYPKLALQNIRRERQFYLPYLLTLMGTAAAFYIATALSLADALPDKNRYFYLSFFMQIGTVVLGLFAVIFLTYTNSFLSKRRQRELGVYHILGMGKGHIAALLAWESLYLALCGVLGGIALGMVLQAVCTWLLSLLMGLPTYFGFFPSPAAALYTALLMGGILLFNLLLSLRRVHAQRPIEMLRGSDVGEREPRTRWLLSLIGVLALGGGYGIALTTRSAMEAIALYFLAVLLVIVGTYCLFTSLSILFLKSLRKNKRFYYKTTHFIGVSGMLYRMKRNAVGLANICILSTMVLVMISGTLTLYTGSQKSLYDAYPGEVTLRVGYDPQAVSAQDLQGMEDALVRHWEGQGFAPSQVGRADYLEVALYRAPDGRLLDGDASLDRPEDTGGATVYFTLMTPQVYEALGRGPFQDDGLAHIYNEGGQVITDLTLHLGEAAQIPWSWPVGAPLSAAPRFTTAFAYLSDRDYTVVLPQTALDQLMTTRGTVFDQRWTLRHCSFWDVGGEVTEDDLWAASEAVIQDSQGTGYDTLSLQSRDAYGEEYLSMNGGFFFLGVFLGLIFLMATALIIYYKQLSEGYEDQRRYHIMVQVGLEPRDVRRSIKSQLRVVFFAPLAVAALHVAFDFPLVLQLLSLFGIRNGGLFLLCTLAVLAGFCLIYWVIYRLTTRAYTRIVG